MSHTKPVNESMSDTNPVDGSIPTLPQEIILAIAHLSGPVRSRKIRRTCKANLKLITPDDLIWGEAGWQHCLDGLEECWYWAWSRWHYKVLWTYMSDVSAEKHTSLFHSAASQGKAELVARLLRDVTFDHSTRDEHFMLNNLCPTHEPSADDVDLAVIRFPRSGQEALMREGLFRAANNNHVDVVRVLLGLGATDGSLSNHCICSGEDPEVLTPDQRALGFATCPEVVRLFLEAGQYAPGNLCLFAAIYSKQRESVKMLLEAGARVNGGELDAAARVGNVAIVRMILSAGASIHQVPDFFQDGGLYNAAWGGHLEVVQLLIAAGAAVEGFPGRGAPLIGAAERGASEVVKLLLEHGADVHRDDDKSLRGVVKGGYAKVVKLLLAAGADASGVWDIAVPEYCYDSRVDVVKVLLEAGADVHKDDDRALKLAARYGHADMVKVLLAAGSDPEVAWEDALSGWVATRSRPWRCTIDVIRLLLDAGVNVRDHHLECLPEAVGRGDTKLVEVLLAAGAPVNLSWQGLLFMAVSGDHHEIVKLLLDAGADVHVHDEEALWTAASRNQVEVVKVLLAGGADVNRPRYKFASWKGESRYKMREVYKLLEEARAV
ncbi:hypothetical protein HDV00_009216 [Rhizophlyctis rosea]|nr:hypothetical protein HDV00_009216 [Rhizophlyctis rosea]